MSLGEPGKEYSFQHLDDLIWLGHQYPTKLSPNCFNLGEVVGGLGFPNRRMGLANRVRWGLVSGS